MKSILLSQFTLLPQELLRLLARARIRTTADLLARAAWTLERKKLLEKKIKVAESDLQPWLVAADLCRLKGLNLGQAQRIALSGKVEAAHRLAELAPDRLHKLLDPQENLPEDFIPTLLARSKKLPPRLIWDDQDVDRYEEITAAFIKSNVIKWNRIVGKIAFVIPVCIFCMLVLVASNLVMMSNTLRNFPALQPLVMKIVQMDQWYYFLDGLALIGPYMLFGMGILLLFPLLTSSVSFAVKRRIKNLYYRKIDLFTNIDSAPVYRASAAVGLVVFLIFMVFATLSITEVIVLSPEDLIKYLPAVLAGMTAILLFIDDYRFIVKVKQLPNKRHLESLPILFSLRLLNTILTALVFILIWAFLKGIWTVHQTIVVHPLVTSYLSWLEGLEPARMSLSDLVDPYDAAKLNYVFEYQRLNIATHLDIFSSNLWNGQFLPMFIQALVWCCILLAVASTVITPILLKDPRKILLVVGVTLGAYFLEKLLGHLTIDMLALPQNSGLALILVFMNVFMSSRATEMMGEISEESDNIICPTCGESLEPTVHFCSACGSPIKPARQKSGNRKRQSSAAR